MKLEDWMPSRDGADMFGLDRSMADGSLFNDRGRVRLGFWRRFANACGAAWAVFRGAMRTGK